MDTLFVALPAWCPNKSGYAKPKDQRRGRFEAGPELSRSMVMVACVVVVMVTRGKRRTGKHQDEQRSSKNFLHAKNLAENCSARNGPDHCAPRKEQPPPLKKTARC